MIENDLKIVHKMYKGSFALKYEDIFKTNREIERDHKTRQTETNDLPIPKWRLTIARQKFSFRTRPVWNFVPGRIRDLKESLFKKEIKKHLKDNEQTYKNFTRDHNIVGNSGNESEIKRQARNENLGSEFSITMNKDAKRNRKKKKEIEQNKKNPYLRKNTSDGRNLIRITQPRIRLAEIANATASQALPG